MPFDNPAVVGGFEQDAMCRRAGDKPGAVQRGDVFLRGNGFPVAACQSRELHLRTLAPDLPAGARIIVEDHDLLTAGCGRQRGGETRRAGAENQNVTTQGLHGSSFQSSFRAGTASGRPVPAVR